MKKFLVLIVLVLAVLLSSCLEEEDYYTRAEIDEMITGIQAQIVEAEPTQEERYVNILVQSMMLDSTIFAEIGQTVSGSVEDWGYSYVVIEVDTAVNVQLKFTQVAPNGEWDINIYMFNQMTEPDYTWEEIMANTTRTLTLQPGFTIIEFDSYSDFTYDYTLQILSVV